MVRSTPITLPAPTADVGGAVHVLFGHASSRRHDPPEQSPFSSQYMPGTTDAGEHSVRHAYPAFAPSTHRGNGPAWPIQRFKPSITIDSESYTPESFRTVYVAPRVGAKTSDP